MKDLDFILSELKSISEQDYLKKMAHFGIDTSKAFGIRLPNIRKLARQIGKNQELSLLLWETGFHEARLLATIIGDYKQVSETQINAWTSDFSSWDICVRLAEIFSLKRLILSRRPLGLPKLKLNL